MIFTILLALSGLILSSVAIYYSVIGLTAIFAAAFWPTVVMGTSLEVSKLVAASWLKANWSRIPLLMKLYMTTAVLVLMFITSMGIFGFLSQAHSDQAVPAGDIVAKIQILDEKIAIQQEYIKQARKDIDVLNTQIDRYNELGAVSRGVRVRDQQKAERETLLSQIDSAQTTITKLREDRAPIAANMRAIEAEVGPIKYIAQFVYDDNPDANILEKAVTWVILIIVAVFDPLAIIMLLAAQMTWQWYKEEKIKSQESVDPDSADKEMPKEEAPQLDETAVQQLPPEESINCTKCGTVLVNAPDIGPFCPNKDCEVIEDSITDDDSSETDTVYIAKAKAKWKEENPNETLKHYRKLYELGVIDKLPWEDPKYHQEDDAYKQNSEQSEGTLWKRILGKKKDV